MPLHRDILFLPFSSSILFLLPSLTSWLCLHEITPSNVCLGGTHSIYSVGLGPFVWWQLSQGGNLPRVTEPAARGSAVTPPVAACPVSWPGLQGSRPWLCFGHGPSGQRCPSLVRKDLGSNCIKLHNYNFFFLKNCESSSYKMLIFVICESW